MGFIMLAVTDKAVGVIRDITTQQNLPEGAGLRIAADPVADSLTLSVSPKPQDGDVVLDASGARIFLDFEAAQLLDDKALDAGTDDSGAVQFAVVVQPGRHNGRADGAG
jgi:Fe-S cluster assembly iron-binding protein IscA